MMREEIIKAIQCCMHGTCSECPFSPFEFTCRMDLLFAVHDLLTDEAQTEVE